MGNWPWALFWGGTKFAPPHFGPLGIAPGRAQGAPLLLSNYGYKKKKSVPVIFEPPCISPNSQEFKAVFLFWAKFVSHLNTHCSFNFNFDYVFPFKLDCSFMFPLLTALPRWVNAVSIDVFWYGFLDPFWKNCERWLFASSCLSVCPSVRMEQLGSSWTYFHEILYLSIFGKYVEKIQVSLKLDKNNRYSTWSPMDFYYHISIIFF